MTLLVSIHDVSPAQAAAVNLLWQICLDRGVMPALLVVPNWHGQWPLDEHPSFVDWIRDRAADGAEIVLHGCRHDENGLRRGWGDEWRAWGKTAREAEFLTLDYAAARARVASGLEQLRTVGLHPTGFVPPAWLARQSGYRAAAEAGLRFTEDDRGVLLLPSFHRIPSPVLRWSARTRLRAMGSVAVARARSLLQRSARLPRIALHPGDLDRSTTARSLERSLDFWLTRHRPGRYADLAAA